MLPAEILDDILDHLHDDHKSLGACALAGRALLPASRYHRFNGRFLTRSRARLLEALLVESSTLAMSITSLSYQPCSLRYEKDAAEIPAAFTFLGLMPNLTDLRIPAPALPYLLHVSSQLRHLRVFNVWLQSREELLAGLSSFANLEELELCDLSLDPRSVEDTVYSLDVPAPHIRRLSFQNTSCASLITRWFHSQGIAPILYRVKLTVQTRDHAYMFVDQSRTLAPLAQELEVVFAPNGTMQGALISKPYWHSCCLTRGTRHSAGYGADLGVLFDSPFLRPSVHVFRDVRGREQIPTVHTSNHRPVVVLLTSVSHNIVGCRQRRRSSVAQFRMRGSSPHHCLFRRHAGPELGCNRASAVCGTSSESVEGSPGRSRE